MVSGVTGRMQITITDPEIPVTSINVSSAGGVTEIFNWRNVAVFSGGFTGKCYSK